MFLFIYVERLDDFLSLWICSERLLDLRDSMISLTAEALRLLRRVFVFGLYSLSTQLPEVTLPSLVV
jgi:hypothetical protein